MNFPKISKLFLIARSPEEEGLVRGKELWAACLLTFFGSESLDRGDLEGIESIDFLGSKGHADVSRLGMDTEWRLE